MPNSLTPLDIESIRNRNRDNLKLTADGGTVPFVAVRGLVLIGIGFDEAYLDFANQRFPFSGQLVVRKGAGRNPGSIIAPSNTPNRAEFESAVRSVSRKTVLYTGPEGSGGT